MPPLSMLQTKMPACVSQNGSFFQESERLVIAAAKQDQNPKDIAASASFISAAHAAHVAASKIVVAVAAQTE